MNLTYTGEQKFSLMEFTALYNNKPIALIFEGSPYAPEIKDREYPKRFQVTGFNEREYFDFFIDCDTWIRSKIKL